jgi:hypothetical protein
MQPDTELRAAVWTAQPLVSNQRGFALALALFSLVVIGALVSGSFFAGRLEQQSGENSIFAAQALQAAEAGLSDVLANANPAAAESLVFGGPPLDLGVLSLNERVTCSRQIIRLTSTLFLIRSTGTPLNADGRPLASSSLGLIVRILPASESVPARFSAIAERAWVQLS